MNYMLGPSDVRRHGECKGCSWPMEAELWRHVRHVTTLSYQVWGESDFAKGRAGRDASVIVKLPKMAFLIRAALNAMSEPRDSSPGPQDRLVEYRYR